MAKPSRPVLPQLIAAVRASGLSSRDLEERTGISHTQVAKILRGAAVPSLENAEKLAAAVGARIRFEIAEHGA
ncbi:MAG: helix-turn-helix transcriptional regulator [Elusimicrobia bacterium]|nr:helix-turn-helix transcriptional regulator [Elusimicrobiota bacterium]